MSNDHGLSLKEQLRQAKEYTTSLDESLTDHALLTLNVTGRVTHWNSGALRILGYTKHEIEGLLFVELFLPKEHREELALQQLKAASETGELRSLNEHVRKDGSSFWADSIITPLKDSRGNLRGYVQIFQDTSGDKKREEALRLKEKRHMLMLESIQDYAIFTLDLDGYVTTWNKGAERVKGYKNEEIIGKHFRVFYTPEEIELDRPEREMQQAIAIGRSENEYWRIRKDGSRFWGNEIITSLRDDQGLLLGFVKVTRDMTERKEAEELSKHQSFHDPLTDLPNRRLGEEWLLQSIAAAKRANNMVAILICDIDHFKKINDTFGHPVGDLVLKEVAKRLQLSVRKEDMVTRLGGDEFLIFLPKLTQKSDLDKIVKKIIHSIRAPIPLATHDLQVKVSIGATFYPADGMTIEVLIKNADSALYQAKALGRNNYQVYTPAKHRTASKRLIMGKSLHQAIKNNEFILYYQPIIDLKTKEIVQIEALIRWVHTERGLIFPDEFMPLIEEEDLFLPLGLWVIQSVCAQIKAWQKIKFPFGQVSFNISATQLAEFDMPLKIKAVLAKKGIDPSLLQIEITENSLMQDISQSIEKLRVLREMGIKIAIDDFGTGYSSLSYLQQLPADRLKIDKSFIRNCAISSRDLSLVEMIVQLGHTLDLHVCAEGVETQEQLTALSSTGCDMVQGFLINYPLPADELTKILGF